MMRRSDTVMTERLLVGMLTALPPGLFTITQLVQAVGNAVPRAVIHATLTRMRASGDLRAFAKLSGETVYAIPYERLPQLYNNVFSDLSESYCDAVPASEDGLQDVIMDMFTLVDLIARERPAITKKGVLPKRTVDRWSEWLTLDPHQCRLLIERKQATTAYPDTLAVVLDLVLRAGLVEMEEGRLVCKPACLATWLKQTDAAIARTVHEVWMMTHCPTDPLARFVGFCLVTLPEGQWIDGVALAKQWHHIAVHKSRRTVEAQLETMLGEINLLREIGMVETGRTQGGNPAFRRRRFAVTAAHEARPLYVQPDGDILLQAHAHYALHYMLLGFSKLVSNDRMRVYRLAPEAVAEALTRGWSIAQLMALLATHAVSGIPEMVKSSLQTWANAQARLHFEPVTAVTFANAEEASQFAAIPHLQQWLNDLTRWTETVYIIRTSQLAAFQSELRSLGLLEMTGIAEGEESAQDERISACDSMAEENDLRGDNEAATRGLFHSPFRYDAYRQRTSEPRTIDLYPDLDNIPAMWHREIRSYHASTLRAIVQRAIEWGCWIESIDEGNEDALLLTPLQITDGPSPELEGYCAEEPVRLPLARLGKVRLVLPGINDMEKNQLKKTGVSCYDRKDMTN